MDCRIGMVVRRYDSRFRFNTPERSGCNLPEGRRHIYVVEGAGVVVSALTRGATTTFTMSQSERERVRVCVCMCVCMCV
jgi:hypothetical protein